MKRKIAWSVAGFVIGMVAGTGLNARAQDPARPVVGPGGPAAKKLALIQLDETSYDFGRVWIGQPPRHGFVVRNTGNAALEIRGIRLSEGLVMERQPASQIEPNGAIEIPIRLEESERPGPLAGQITIESNDPITPVSRISVTANRQRPIEIRPMMAGFGRVIGYEPKQVIVTLTNQTEASLDLVLIPPERKQFECELIETTPGIEYKLLVTFRPPQSAGRIDTTIRLKTNLDLAPELAIKAMAFVPPRIEVIPPAIIIDAPAQQAMDASKGLTKVLVFSNNGEEPVKILKAVAADPAIHVATATISEGKSYSLRVTFPPGYNPPRPGPTVNIETSDREEPLIRVPISTRDSDLAALLKVEPKGPRRVDEFVGRPLPAFELTTREGTPLRPADLRNNITLLHIFALGDSHSASSVQKVERLRQAYEPKGVRFINICGRIPLAEFPEETIVEALKAMDIHAQLVMDLGNTTVESFKLVQFPTTMFVGRTGKVEGVIEGDDPQLTEKAQAKLNALIANVPIPSPAAGSTPAQRPALTMIGKPAPAFTLDLGPGKEQSAVEIDSRPATVLNFVAPNCGYCKRQIPEVERVRAEFESKGVRFINVSQTMRKRYTNEEFETVMAGLGSKLEIAYDPANRVGLLFKATSYPTMAVVNRKGVIQHVNIGAKKNLAEMLRGQLDAILKADGEKTSGTAPSAARSGPGR